MPSALAFDLPLLVGWSPDVTVTFSPLTSSWRYVSWEMVMSLPFLNRTSR